MYKDENASGAMASLGFVVIVLFAIVGLGALISSITSVEPGFVGVVFDKQTKEINPTPLHPGWSFVKPFSVQVIEMETRIQKEQVNASAASKDLQSASTAVALNYRISPDNAPYIYENIGMDYKIRVIDPAIQESVKASTATYTAEDLIVKRESVRDAIETSLRERLLKYRVEVDSLSITNFDFSPEFQKAIEDKQTAAQLALKAENDLQRIKVEAAQKVATAEAEAKAIEIRGKALRDNPQLVQLEMAQKWNGIMPSFYVAGQSGLTGGLLFNVPSVPTSK